MRRNRVLHWNDPNGPNVPPSPCPSCGTVCDTASGVNQEPVILQPENCFAVCIVCGAINGYDEKHRLRKPSSEELASCLEHPEQGPIFRDLQRAARQCAAKRALDRGIQPNE